MLETVDLKKQISRAQYDRELLRHQLELHKLAFNLYQKKRALVIVFEGWDAAGKGGAIKRITECLNPRETGPARLRGAAHRRAHRRGQDPPLSVAVLAAVGAARG